MGKSKGKSHVKKEMRHKKEEKRLQALKEEKRLQALIYPAKIEVLSRIGKLPRPDELPSPTTLIESVAPIAGPEHIFSIALKKLEAVLSAPVLGSQPLPEVETEVAIPIIEFVEEVEKSHQYFLFKEYIRADCPKITYDADPYDLSYELIKENEQGHRFNLLEDEEVRNCVHDYLFELRAKRYMDRRKNRRKSHEKNRQLDNNMFNLLGEEDNEEDSGEDIPDIPHFEEILARKTDLFAARAPVQYMVYRAREECYVMDEDPEAELKKLKKLAPMFYNEHFIRREPPVEAGARTLIISNLSPDLSEKDFRSYLATCGRVENSKLQSVAQGKIGYVTFKNLSSADYAQNRYDGIGINYLSIEISFMLYAPLHIQRQSLEPVPVVKDVTSMYAAALNKYSALRAYLLQVEPKVVRPFTYKEFQRDFQEGCHLMVERNVNWMAVEAMANGGYRQDGGIWRHVPEPHLRRTICL